MSAGFTKLLDNYERSSGVAERVTAEELTEINLFLDAVLQTEVMKVHLTCYNQLHLTSLSISSVTTTPHFLHLFVFWVSRAFKSPKFMYKMYIIS